MAYLINEMMFLLLATAIISGLLGRFLCKSNDRGLFAEKKQCLSELTSIQKQRDDWEVRANQWQKKFEEANEKLATHEYDKNSLQSQLESTEQERQSLLQEVKKVDLYKAKWDSTSEELACLQAQLQNALKKLDMAQQKIAQLNESNSTLEEKLEKLKQHLINQVEKNQAFKEHCHHLRANNQELKVIEKDYLQLKQNFDELSGDHHQLKVDNEDLLLDREKLERLQTQYENLAEESKDLSELRQKTSSLTKERNKLRSKAQQLQHQLASISEAHDEQVEMVHRLISQRDDFLSRLHAVSSVVGAMGVSEQHE